MQPWEISTIEQVRAECKIPADWEPKQFTGAFRLLDDVGQAADALATLTGHDKEEIRRALLGQISFHHLPEESVALTFASPDGEESVLTVMTPRDQQAGTNAYLSRLNLSQLRYARDEADSRIKMITKEKKRTVWRVCSDDLCLKNFRDTEYLDALTFMGEEGKRLHAKFGKKVEHSSTDMKLELVPLRVPESEYESWFK